MMSMVTKLAIIGICESGMSLSAITSECERDPSTIGTMLKQKDAIEAVEPSKNVTVLSSKRTYPNNKMEILLLWIDKKQLV